MLPRGIYEGTTASAHDVINLKTLSCEGTFKSSKKIPPNPLHSPTVIRHY